MTSESPSVTPRPSRTAFWIGWVLTVLPAPLLAFSAIMKFVKPPEVVKGFIDLGWPEKLALSLGIVELSCVVLLLIPRTAVLGAILLAGYMGGAIATHVRLEQPFFMQAAVGVIAWLGLYLREPRLRALIPLRTPPEPRP